MKGQSNGSNERWKKLSNFILLNQFALEWIYREFQKKNIMKWKIQCDVENRGRKVNLISIFILNLIRCSMFIQQDIFLLLFIYFSSEAIRAWMAGIFFSSRVVSVWLINTRKWKLIMHLSRTQKNIYIKWGCWELLIQKTIIIKYLLASLMRVSLVVE